MADTLVLCYHGVSEDWPAALSVTPGAFEDQLSLLVARGYRGVTFSQAVAGADGRVVAVTFDDGFRSVLERAAPVLERLGLPGTLFVVTDWVGRAEPMAWPGIDRWLGGPHEQELHGVSWDEVRGLAAAGWEIGSHTRSHPYLTRLDEVTLADELRVSRARVEEELGRPCPTIAYPYGDVDAPVVRAAAEAGYTAGAALPKSLAPPSALEWPRAGIWHDDGSLRFRLKVSPLVRRLRSKLPK